MAEFDREKWRMIAWERLRRSSKKKSKSKKVDTSWLIDLIAIDNITKIVEWCKDHGLKVEFSSKCTGIYCPNSRTIKIPSKLHFEKQVHYLLHECGHHLIDSDEHHDRFGMGYPKFNDPIIKKTFLHRVSCLEEEMEAWNRGWRLSNRLDLNVNREEFDKVRLNCIRTYIKWALSPGPSEKDPT